MPKIILINGPKRSGKDTAGSIMRNIYGFDVSLKKFATPLYEAIPIMFGLTMASWADIYENEKETPDPRLRGMSPRQAMIWLSEEVIKPKFGQSFFGDSMVNAIGELPNSSIVVTTDSRFVSESIPVVDHYGSDNVFLIRLYREGTSFDGDTGSYMYAHDIGIPESHECEIRNDYGFAELRDSIKRFVGNKI